MPKNISKIYRRTALIILAIMVSGLLNVCMFALQTKAAEPMPAPKFNFISDDSGNCTAEPMPEPMQSINRPTAPMPQCCLTQNRNFDAVVNTANDKSAPIFSGLIISPSTQANPENNSTHYTSRLTYPPPEALSLASTVIRE